MSTCFILCIQGRNKNQGQGGTGFQGYYGQGSYGRGAETDPGGEYESSGDDYEEGNSVIHN